ncbi:SNF2 family N-terminal domain-containing protein [Formosa sp. Hel1_31_208]|uniref:helicase-related protein n=1 Tax=Formosa sp. Hel1_31_208 TaxID=1798225 RepID=UPI00087D3727|nr:helicase-related protein [Formosa sp. Hel1_31_208]SDR90446.1 SNF2 family N-terminal domain-containing protein [Formosa sp. Hel1_31_208]
MISQGQIIKLRNRLWRVEDNSESMFSAIPLSGDSLEKTTFLKGVEKVQDAKFETISSDHPGNYSNQKLLQTAYKFDLIHASAPFLSLQRSAVIPFDYQLVPLVLSLERPQTRLLIADDVGLGKTIEAGLILSEAIQRGNAKRILILTPANLKEQWQEALSYFFHINSQIISSYTRKEYEKELPIGTSPWKYFDVVIASLDYAKAPNIQHQILEHQWDYLIVDEVHLCARPHQSGSQAGSKSMLRYELLKNVSSRIQNVLFLTATPHNGYSDSFASIIELLNPKIVTYKNHGKVSFNKKEARFNVCQRNREKIEAWYKEQERKSPFPKRIQKEIRVQPSSAFEQLLEATENYTDKIIHEAIKSGKRNMVSQWVAIHLQKRAISSPYALLQSLRNRLFEQSKHVELKVTIQEQGLFEGFINDALHDHDRMTEEETSQKLDTQFVFEGEKEELERLIDKAKKVSASKDDKLKELMNNVLPDLKRFDQKIIVFTKYKDTLDYLEKNLKSNNNVLTVHGGLSLNKRRDIFIEFDKLNSGLLIATDAISEGLNLQRLSSCIVHYELPWNPNRLEQRNGRIDRIGQPHDTVHIRALVLDKTLDVDILHTLIRKAVQIRTDRGYSAAFFGNESELNQFILNQYKKRRIKKSNEDQLDIFKEAGVGGTKEAINKSVSISEAERNETIVTESFYDLLNVNLPEIEKRIKETNNIVGSKEELIYFVKAALKSFQGELLEIGAGFYKIALNDPRLESPQYNNDNLNKVTFDPEEGLQHPDAIVLELGHPLVRKLISLVKSDFFQEEGHYGRNAYVLSKETLEKLFHYQFLVRFITGRKKKNVVEELLTVTVNPSDKSILSKFSPKADPSLKRIQIEDFKVDINSAIKESLWGSALISSIKKRKDQLINERQELYKKIIADSSSTNQPDWIDDLMFIELAGYDLLTLTVIYPA